MVQIITRRFPRFPRFLYQRWGISGMETTGKACFREFRGISGWQENRLSLEPRRNFRLYQEFSAAYKKFSFWSDGSQP